MPDRVSFMPSDSPIISLSDSSAFIMSSFTPLATSDIRASAILFFSFCMLISPRVVSRFFTYFLIPRNKTMADTRTTAPRIISKTGSISPMAFIIMIAAAHTACMMNKTGAVFLLFNSLSDSFISPSVIWHEVSASADGVLMPVKDSQINTLTQKLYEKI